jgi:neutral ceramidase
MSVTDRAIVAALLGVAACSAMQMPGVTKSTVLSYPPHTPTSFKAGASRADITPPPGAGTFGQGPRGLVAQGYWSRLYCRAFAFDIEGAAPLAIVPCDLGAVSMLLQRRVATLTHDIGIDAPRLMLTASNTSAGPAHFFDGVFYGGPFSSRLPGYDDRMTAFLAGRIAHAVHAAWASRVPAALAWGRSEVWELTRNRNLVPYLANRPRFAPLPPDDLRLVAQERAIDPALNVLRIDAVEPGHPAQHPQPIGALTFFAMSAMAMPDSARLYGAGIDGVVERATEREMRRAAESRGLDPLSAMISTNDGDVSPAWERGTLEEAEEIGARLAESVWEAYEDAGHKLHDRVVLDERYLEIDLPGAHMQDGTGSLRRRPELARGPYTFPSRVPLALVRMDDTLVSFLPVRPTITVGARINERALAADTTSEPAAHAVVAGLANGYLGYVTTPEEFALQRHEVNTDLYGPMTAPLLAERLSLLVRSMNGADVSALLPRGPRLGEATPIAYETGPNRPRFARPEDDAGLDEIVASREPIGLCTIRPVALDPPAFCFWWGDAGLGRVSLTEEPWIVLVEGQSPARSCGAPLFALGGRALSVTGCDPAATIDDRGLDFQTLAHDRFGDALVWSTEFRPTRAEWTELSAARALSIVAREATGGRDVASPPFSAVAMPSPCTPAAERFCAGR